MGIGEPHRDCLAFTLFDLATPSPGRRLHLGDAFTEATPSSRRRLHLGDACTQLKMKSPDVNSGDQVTRDRQSKHIAEDEGGADYEGGRRDHREGVYEGTLTRQSQ